MNNKKTLVLIITIIAVGLVATSATFAWFLWYSDDSEKTNVTFTVPNGAGQMKVILDADSTEFTDMYPTSGCDKNGAKMATITVYTENNTTAAAFIDATLSLDSVTAGPGGGTPDRSAIHYALSTNPKATCNSGIFEEGTLSGKSNGDAIYNGDLSIIKIPKNQSMTSTTLYLYMWIDENYEFYNTGNSIVTDPMQNMKVKVVWSGNVTNGRPDVTGGVFTFSETPIVLDEPMPEGVNTFDNHLAAEAEGGNYNIYGRSIVSNNIVTENYIGFTITEDMENDIPGTAAGSYVLRALVIENDNSKPIFESNIATLKKAFGEENCTMREDGSQYQCIISGGNSYSGMSVFANIWGSGGAYSGGNRYCVSSIGTKTITCYTSYS